jgi:hypothetical protein
MSWGGASSERRSSKATKTGATSQPASPRWRRPAPSRCMPGPSSRTTPACSSGVDHKNCHGRRGRSEIRPLRQQRITLARPEVRYNADGARPASCADCRPLNEPRAPSPLCLCPGPLSANTPHLWLPPHTCPPVPVDKTKPPWVSCRVSLPPPTIFLSGRSPTLYRVQWAASALDSLCCSRPDPGVPICPGYS